MKEKPSKHAAAAACLKSLNNFCFFLIYILHIAKLHIAYETTMKVTAQRSDNREWGLVTVYNKTVGLYTKPLLLLLHSPLPDFHVHILRYSLCSGIFMSSFPFLNGKRLYNKQI